MNQKSSIDKISERQVLIFPASTPDASGKSIFFLFSVLQVEEILKETRIHSVPFCPNFAEGISEWRERVLPVISLEARLGLETAAIPEPQRLIVVRTSKDVDTQSAESKGILILSSAVRKMKLPIPCVPYQSNGLFTDNTLLKGVYEWEEGLLIVVDMEKILSGKNENFTPNRPVIMGHTEAMAG